MATAITTTYDQRVDAEDQQWLAERITALAENATAIIENWDDGRCVGRFHPGMSPGDYVHSLNLRLTLTEALPLPLSAGEVAKVAGVSKKTVLRKRAQVETNVLTSVVGKDGKTYPANIGPKTRAPRTPRDPTTITPKQARDAIAKVKEQFKRDPEANDALVLGDPSDADQWADHVESTKAYTKPFLTSSDAKVAASAAALMACLNGGE